ncbi:MAG TPA: MFS transporter [Burkholderiales bacterium]|jgi:MFS family permease|nr:MFS transporter [Burkholderiales bacterium]
MSAPRLSPALLTLLMCVAEVFQMTGFAAYTTLLPVLQKEWGLANSEAGLISGIYFAGYVAATPVLTSLTDRVDARRVYLAACVLSLAGAAGFMLLADGLWSAMVFQFLIGAGLGGSYMPGLKMLADQLEGPAQSRSVGFYTASFGLGSTFSILICGWIGNAYGWQAAFAWGAAGPVAAALLAYLVMPRGRTRAASRPAPALLDFRPVLKNRRTLPFIIGYSAHNYELFGQRSWMVAFLVFSASLQPADAPMLFGAATLAATINLLGPIMSVSGNEIAIRFGRTRVIFTFMTASGLLACVLGYSAPLPWVAVFLIMCLHYGLMLGDSAALTSGAIASAPPDERGATMAVYSFVGFSSAVVAPLVFGVVLDLAGGNQSVSAWGLAFASIGIFGVLSPIARWIYLRRAAQN